VPAPTRPSWHRRAPLAALVLSVLAAHALLLAGVTTGQDGRSTDSHPGSPPLQVRQIVLPVAVAPVPAPAPAAPPPRVAAPVRPAAVVAVAVAPPVTEPSPQPAPTPPPQVAMADAAPAPAAPPAAEAESSAGEAPPTFTTRPPPAAELHYELRRGVLSGQGLLSWRPAGEHYELQIDGNAFGVPVLVQHSSGGFDRAGLAPLRFVDRRRGRDQRAANFQRDKGLITWSGTVAETRLLPGAQDRLSWMVQLAAIVAAQPERWVAGERIPMLVVGARGDADVWTFVVSGREPVDVAGARVENTLALRREPRKPYDTAVQVWLDPQRHHLPVRLRLATAGGNDALELLLKP
jgi:hypothetical protein